MTSKAFDSAEAAFAALTRGFFVESAENGDPIPMVSDDHRDGVIAVVFSDRGRADEMAAGLAEDYGQETKVVPVKGLWDTVVHLAKRGIAGIMLDGTHPVFFLNRLADIDRAAPTLALLQVRRLDETGPVRESSDELYFGVSGPIAAGTGLLPWHNYRAMDAMSARWMLGEHPLPESLEPFTLAWTDGTPIETADGATLLGPYVSDQGAVPVFSSRDWAEYFGLVTGRLRFQGGEIVAADEVSVSPIRGNFTAFLDRIWESHGPFLDIGLNPRCHRFRQGYFFSRADSDGWFMRTLSGTFLLRDGRFERRDDVEPTKRDDDVGGRSADYDAVAGLASVVRHPFKRLLGANTSPVPPDEAEGIVAAEFRQSTEASYERPPISEVGVDRFVIDGFDKITGESLSYLAGGEEEPCDDDETGGPESDQEGKVVDDWFGPLVFSDLSAACVWLFAAISPIDERVRIRGAATCHGPWHPGSGDAEAEAGATRALETALHRLVTAALTGGYRPVHAFHLQRLFQDASRVLEITRAGYVGDLLFYEEADDPVSALGFPENFRKRSTSLRDRLRSQVEVDDVRASELRRHLGRSYDELEAASRLMLSAAFEELHRVGRRADYDYAGVSLKLCKTVERELKHRVFDAWRGSLRSRVGKSGVRQLRKDAESHDDDRTGRVALDFLEKRGNVELGSMRYLLKAVGAGASHPAIVTLRTFLETRREPGWLISEELELGLVQVADRYRNGGVHEHLVSHELCVEAMEFLLRSEAALLPRLIRATSDA